MKKKNTSPFASQAAFFAAFCAALFLTSACKKETPAPAERPPIPVEAFNAQKKDVPLYVDTIGKTTAFNSGKIQNQVSGQLLKIHFKQGEYVQKGALLFSIDPAPYEARLAAAKASLAKDEASLAIDEKLYERSKTLVSQNYVSQQQFQEYEANVLKDKAAIEGDKAAIRSAQIDLDYCTIKAPVDGMVGFYAVNEGNILYASSPSTLTTLETLKPLYLDFTVASSDLAQINAYLRNNGGKLKIEAAASSDPSRKREAELTAVGNAVATSTGTVQLRGVMANDDLYFWPNEPMNVRIVLTTLKDAVLVRDESVRYNQQGVFVWAVKDGVAQQIPVQIGQLQEGGLRVISKGVEAGWQIVTAGSLMLQPGSKVVVIDPKKQAEMKAKQEAEMKAKMQAQAEQAAK